MAPKMTARAILLREYAAGFDDILRLRWRVDGVVGMSDGDFFSVSLRSFMMLLLQCVVFAKHVKMNE